MSIEIKDFILKNKELPFDWKKQNEITYKKLSAKDKARYIVFRYVINYLRPLIIGEVFQEFEEGIPKLSNHKLLLVPKKLKKWSA